MEIPTTKNQAFFFKHGWMLLCFATLWSPYLTLRDCGFPAIFNFGDSNSDIGVFSAAYYPITSPYGETYFGKPSGRASDGRLIIDFLVGASTIKPLGRILKRFFNLCPLYLDIELTQFFEFIPRSQTIRKQGGMFAELMLSNESFSRALYTIDMSQNDFGNGFTDTTIEEVNATVPDLAKLISKHIQGLYNLGACSFWIHNAAPIDCLAYILSHAKLKRHEIDRAGCGIPSNDVVQYYNQKLKEEVVALREGLPDVFITYVDIYSIKYSFFRWPRKYAPIDCLAYILSHAKLKRHEIDRAGCGIPSNDVVQYYNQKLKEEVVALREGLPDVFITYVDIYSIKYSFFRWPRKYGYPSHVNSLVE
ncbi:unnamed protein product [Ilex paraguariensis]|uniref:Esterase n=1 Tax=Ilex paraguariensis TaxID=185542 RepID=A0ABC8TJ80_9AQUA